MALSTTALPQYAVGIDVETTSLDPTTGDIIDVAAIRYDLRTGEEVARVAHLTRPTRPLSEEIMALTGIRQEMVADAPPFSAVKDAVAEFIGQDAVFAHNATFDLGYLAQHGVTLKNPVWDTFLLASVAWPEVASYNLGFLAQELAITVRAEHRAAADVALSWQLLRRIQEELVLTPELYERVTAILQKGGLSHYLPLFSGTGEGAPAPVKPHATTPLSNNSTHAAKGPILEVTTLFSAQGPLTNLTGYEMREEQARMATTVAQWIADGRCGLIEAGTGVGKTFAYLAAAVAQLTSVRPVVISTYTKQLQDQLVHHDIPKLLALIEHPAQVATLKGRGNYLCTARLSQALKRPAFSQAESFLFIKLLRWLASGGSGDLEQVNLSHQGHGVLRALHADSPICRAICSRELAVRCPYQRARKAAQQADILVVNHALLTKLSAGEESALPARVIIIDEAHHLEEAARQASQVDLSPERILEVLGSLQSVVVRHGEASLAERATAMSATIVASQEAWRQEVGQWVERHSETGRVWLNAVARRGSEWQRLATQAETWRSQLKFLVGLARSLGAAIPAAARASYNESLAEAERFGVELQQYLDGNSERIQWIGRDVHPYTQEVTVQLNDVALSVAALLHPLFSSTKSTILTSATLSVNGKFAYLQKMLGLEKAETVSLGTPFNLRDQMLLYLVDDAPIPVSRQFEPFLAKVITSVALALQGRTLVLFTAKAMIKKLYPMLIQRLNRAHIRLFAQNMTGGRKNMLERFRSIQKSVLLGTATFWEGIDVPGESLSCVIIPKLPFAPPDDPIVSALAQSLQVNAFQEIALPRMLITLRQGVGRLLRSATDKGVVVILDPRLHHAEYGQSVIQNLPPATTHVGGVVDLIPTIEKWFGKSTLARWKKPDK